MKPAYWDSGIRWDDPNLRWGSPSYILEPGDPGYVEPLPTTIEPKTKNKRMRRNRYYPMRQGDQITWLANFANKLATLGTGLGMTSAQVTAAIADCNWLIYILQSWLPAVRAWALGSTGALTEAETGTGNNPQALPVFTAPALPTGVVAVNPGALNRIFDLVQQIKDSGKATEAISSNLGIVGSEDSAPDLSTVQPKISAKVSGATVDIKWGWGGNGAFLDACEILVDRGDGQGFKLLVHDTTPNYTDTQAFPVAKTIWTYKAIYRVDAAQVGLWSATVSVNVGG